MSYEYDLYILDERDEEDANWEYAERLVMDDHERDDYEYNEWQCLVKAKIKDLQTGDYNAETY